MSYKGEKYPWLPENVLPEADMEVLEKNLIQFFVEKLRQAPIQHSNDELIWFIQVSLLPSLLTRLASLSKRFEDMPRMFKSCHPELRPKETCSSHSNIQTFLNSIEDISIQSTIFEGGEKLNSPTTIVKEHNMSVNTQTDPEDVSKVQGDFKFLNIISDNNVGTNPAQTRRKSIPRNYLVSSQRRGSLKQETNPEKANATSFSIPFILNRKMKNCNSCQSKAMEIKKLNIEKRNLIRRLDDVEEFCGLMIESRAKLFFEKADIMSELESLTQALFEEANKMVSTERRSMAEMVSTNKKLKEALDRAHKSLFEREAELIPRNGDKQKKLFRHKSTFYQ